MRAVCASHCAEDGLTVGIGRLGSAVSYNAEFASLRRLVSLHEFRYKNVVRSGIQV